MDILKKQREHESSECGMTLVEVMISMIILGVVLVGLGQALTFGIKVNTETKMRVASLNVCKYLTENLKSQISQSGTFDDTAPSDTTYYVDADGNKTYSGGVEAFTSASAFRARVVVSNSALSKTVNGVTNVLVKVLKVTVVDVQNRDKPGRDISMQVEIIRPSA